MLAGYDHVYLDSAFTTFEKPKGVLGYHDPSPPMTELDLLVQFLPYSKRRQLAPEVAKLRRIKSKAEIKLMKKAADISATAHAKVRANAFRPRAGPAGRHPDSFTDYAVRGTRSGGIRFAGSFRISLCAGRLRAAGLRPCGGFRVSLLQGGEFLNNPCYSSPNALIIHYTANDHVLRKGELVLVDAGGEYRFVLLRHG